MHVVTGQDKIFHFGAFTIFSYLAVFAVRHIPKLFFMTGSSFVFSVGTGFGLVTEFLQRNIPGRSTQLADGIMNIAGILFGMLLAKLIIFTFNSLSYRHRAHRVQNC
ncbi:MAG: VanZ family protein [Candidatus Omnitrophica bacterium]|nr:VanZ family protein [Candidatus Omnitrophota bacterium]